MSVFRYMMGASRYLVGVLEIFLVSCRYLKGVLQIFIRFPGDI